ncbi:hypothetical protein PIROE2DRAFT_1993, partial [Piromyces sp. E2]
MDLMGDGYPLMSKTKLYKYYSVPTDAPAPTVNTASPDLSIAKEYNLCNSIEGSTACDGYNYYIPQTGHFISVGGSVSEFDKYVNSEVNNDSGILFALCPNANIQHDVSKIAFRYSVYCGRYMYAQARWCEENNYDMRANPQKSLCRSTCVEFANSYVDYGLSVCKNQDNSKAEEIRDNIIEKWCNLFTDDEGCIKGTTRETELCGYNSAEYALNEAPQNNPSNKCWAKKDEWNQKREVLQVKASEEKKVKMGNIKWKVIYPYAVILIVGVLTYFFWLNQNKKYKNEVISYKPSKEEKYEISPSKVGPSRDYIDNSLIRQYDEDYIKNVLEQLPPTLPPRVSSTEYETNRSSDKNIYLDDDDEDKYHYTLFEFKPENDDEIELKVGDRLEIKKKLDN